MRLNKWLALATGMGRRPADQAIADGRVQVNGMPAQLGQTASDSDTITLDGKRIRHHTTDKIITIMFNKPAGYVVSRDGQGNKTIYDLLPPVYQQLKPIGRLDMYSSGLLLMTSDGQLAQELTHPSRQKVKVYEVTLNKPLQPLHHQIIGDHGVQLEDGPSKFLLERLQDGDDTRWRIAMHEGRNRQIRRTFKSLGYHVTRLHRTHFGPYQLAGLAPGATRPVASEH